MLSKKCCLLCALMTSPMGPSARSAKAFGIIAHRRGTSHHRQSSPSSRLIVLSPRKTVLRAGDGFRHSSSLSDARSSTGDESSSLASTIANRQLSYPRAAVAAAVRCCDRSDSNNSSNNGGEPSYLLVRRGKEPNKGQWSLPGGKLEWGETAIEGAKRELSEEVIFEGANKAEELRCYRLAWCPEPCGTADSIIVPATYPAAADADADAHGNDGSDKDSTPAAASFHYLIALCFAELLPVAANKSDNKCAFPPGAVAGDDAKDAKWWSIQEILDSELAAGNNSDDNSAALFTPRLGQRIQRIEHLYRKGVLLPDD